MIPLLIQDISGDKSRIRDFSHIDFGAFAGCFNRWI